MKLNEEKCHFFISGHKYEHIWAKVGNAMIWQSESEKLLGALIDKDLKFDEHVSNLCKKVGQKISMLSRITKYMIFHKR